MPNVLLHTILHARYARRFARAAAGFLVATTVACQPGSVTEARDQLGRGGARTFSLTLPVTVDSAVVDDFLDGVNDTVVNGVVGVPVEQRSLTVPVVPSFVSFDEVPGTAVDFGEFEDAVRDATIASSPAQLRLTNPSGQTATLSNVVVGVAALNPDGSLPVDGSGNPIYDTDAAGAPRSMNVSDPGSPDVTIGPASTNTLDLGAATIVDGVVDLILDGQRPAVVVTGDGAGPLGTFLSVTIDMVALFDFILPPSGVSITSNTTQTGAELETRDADQVADRVESAAFIAEATNGTAFAADIAFALIEGDSGSADVFTIPGSIQIAAVSLDAGAVDASGQLTTPVVDTVTIQITGTQARPLLGTTFTATSRITLRPVSPSNRAVIRPADVVRFSARAQLRLRSGATP